MNSLSATHCSRAGEGSTDSMRHVSRAERGRSRGQRAWLVWPAPHFSSCTFSLPTTDGRQHANPRGAAPQPETEQSFKGRMTRLLARRTACLLRSSNLWPRLCYHFCNTDLLLGGLRPHFLVCDGPWHGEDCLDVVSARPLELACA